MDCKKVIKNNTKIVKDKNKKVVENTINIDDLNLTDHQVSELNRLFKLVCPKGFNLEII